MIYVITRVKSEKRFKRQLNWHGFEYNNTEATKGKLL